MARSGRSRSARAPALRRREPELLGAPRELGGGPHGEDSSFGAQMDKVYEEDLESAREIRLGGPSAANAALISARVPVAAPMFPEYRGG